MGREELISDERYEVNNKRVQNLAALSAEISAWSGKYSVDELLAILEKNAVPTAPVLTIDKVVNDPHINARNMMVEVDHPVAGKVVLPGNPIKLSASCDNIERPSPILGQHTDEVLTELGYTAEKLAELRAAKII
jgi:crotonobetainyl-CoA:carnitine CoA-transferase CaiB-like acyl-CoA transferase